MSSVADLKPCGTNAAYQRHRSRGEEPCEPCREAYREYSRVIQRPMRRASALLAEAHPEEYQEAVREQVRRGVTGSTRYNRARGALINARPAEYDALVAQERTSPSGIVGRPLKPCGTDAAHKRHRVRGEEPCEPCRKAHREYSRAYMAEYRQVGRG